MKFFGRTNEILFLRQQRALSHDCSRFTVVTGRRRVGKTELITQALGDGVDCYIYLLLTRQTERNLVAGLQDEITRTTGDRLTIYGACERLIDLVREVFRLAERECVTLVIDEFQEMDRINPGFYGELQGLWDSMKGRMRLNLVVSGSVNRMMNRIFFDYSEPLYGRNTSHLRLQPFPTSLLKEIFATYQPDYTKDDLLALWTMTGGVARYVSLMMDARATRRKSMLELFFSGASPFLEEGRSILLQEFGPDAATYFTILSSLATGHTKFAEIKNDMGRDVGAYLSNLEKNYNVIRKVSPIFSPEGCKNTIYRLEDPFLRFWFRYVFKCATWVELGKFEQLRTFVAADFNTFSGVSLERYFQKKLAEESSYTNMGGWWDRKGENEIDLVCQDEMRDTLDFYEIKHNPQAIDLNLLEKKTMRFFEKNPDMTNVPHRCLGLSLNEM